MTQSREKEKRKPKEKPKKINKTTRNLVSGYYPEMRFFLLKRKRREKRKKEKTKRRPKRDWTGGFVGAVFGKPDGHAVA